MGQVLDGLEAQINRTNEEKYDGLESQISENREYYWDIFLWVIGVGAGLIALLVGLIGFVSFRHFLLGKYVNSTFLKKEITEKLGHYPSVPVPPYH